MELTAENVWNIFAECLGGDPDTSVIVDGIVNQSLRLSAGQAG